MSIRIKLSYENEQEFRYVRRKLWRAIKRLKKEPATGKYHRAYFDLEIPANDRQPDKNGCNTITKVV